MIRTTSLALTLVLAALTLRSTAARAQTVFPAAGATPTAIQGAADGFRIHVGGLNPNQPGAFPAGRREIDWDDVADADAAEGILPADFFNLPLAPRARGVVLSTPGIGFQVSAAPGNPAGTAPAFGNLNATYATAFPRFSGTRLFTALGSNVVDVHFVVPGSDAPAIVRAFGAVFADVDTAASAMLEFFAGARSLGVFNVLPFAGGLSFLGVDFGTHLVSRVRITSGQAAPGPNDLSDGGGADIVVMDDFIYGEPVPAAADLRLSIGAAPDPTSVGDELTYTVTVDNRSPYAAADVVVTVTTPETAAIVAASGSCAWAGATVTCDVGTLQQGLGATVHVMVVPTEAGELEARATVTSTNDFDEGDNDGTVVTTALPVCSDENTLEVAACRLALLGHSVEVDVADLGMAGALLKQVRLAERRTRLADAASTVGNSERARASLKRAIGALGAFGRRIGSRRARRGIPTARRLRLAATAAELRSMLEALR